MIMGLENELNRQREYLEKERRKADVEREERQSIRNDELIKTNKKKKKIVPVKSKSKVKSKEKNEEVIMVEGEGFAMMSEDDNSIEEDDDDNDIWDPDDWKVLEHFVNRRDSRPMFKVNIGLKKPTFCEAKDLIKDGAGASMKEYIKKNCNFPPWSHQLDVIIGQKEKRKASNKDENSIQKEVWGWGKDVSKKITCDHELYEVDITYKPEQLASYCNEGFYLAGLKCGQCTRCFVPNRKAEKELGEHKCVKPTSDCPVYCCVNMMGSGSLKTVEGNCRHAICSDCWRKGVLAADTGSGKKRPKRTRLSK